MDGSIARANQNTLQMKWLGVTYDEAGRTLLRQHGHEVVNDVSHVVRRFTTLYGTFETIESLLAGPSGKFAKCAST